MPDEERRLTTADFELDRLRYLAARDLLSEEEVKELLAGSRDRDLTPYARERAEASADAVLEGLAERNQHERDR